MSLREEIENRVQNLKDSDGLPPYCYYTNAADEILQLILNRIDAMIKVDDETFQRDLGTKEGKIAAQASKNTLTLVKELLTK